MTTPLRDSAIRLSADVGGTFTDVAAFDENTGALRLGKTLTTPQRLVTGIESGVGKAGSQLRGGAAVPARHHGRDQHHPGAQRREMRAADHAGLPRHLRDRPRQPARVLQSVLPEAHAADRPRPALRNHGADGLAGHDADPARRGAGAERGTERGRAGRAGDRHPVPALVPQPGARTAREDDHHRRIPGPFRHELARAQPGIPRVRAHFDRRGQRLCRPARAALSDRDGKPSRDRRIHRQFPHRPVDRRAVRCRRCAPVLHPDAGVRPRRRRGRHQGAVRFHQHSQCDSL